VCTREVRDTAEGENGDEKRGTRIKGRGSGDEEREKGDENRHAENETRKEER
jgi:hypothetical protein